MQAIHEGLGGSSFALDDSRASLAEHLKRNIYLFSGAKSFVQYKQYRDMMIGEDGHIMEFTKFRKLIADQGEIYNKHHLNAEYHVARQSAIMAHKWESLNSEYLEYSTVGDGNVRPEHKLLDKFTAAKTHPVWDKIYPVKAWGCRCNVVPGKAQNVGKVMSEVQAAKMMKPLIKDTIFDNHVGKSKVVFPDSHPHIEFAGRRTKFNWKSYGLPGWDKIALDELPPINNTSRDEYLNWWSRLPKKGSTDDVVVKDVTGTEVMLPSGVNKSKSLEKYFKHHILDNNDQRHHYATHALDLLTNPDEIWSNNGDRIYVKFFAEGPIKLVVNNQLRSETMFLIKGENKTSWTKARTGTLLYNNRG